MYVVLFGRVHCNLGGRQREDQPAVTCIDRLVLQDVAEERAVSLGILAIDDDVSAVNHSPSVPHPPRAAQLAVAVGRTHQSPFGLPLAFAADGTTVRRKQRMH